MRRRKYPDGPSGHLELRAQPGVIRHAVVSSSKPDVRSVMISLQHADVRVAIEIPDPAELIADLEAAIKWRDSDDEA